MAGFSSFDVHEHVEETYNDDSLAEWLEWRRQLDTEAFDAANAELHQGDDGFDPVHEANRNLMPVHEV